jgi:ABC-2 type transport system permease protein
MPKLPKWAGLDELIHESALGGVTLPNPIEQTIPAWSLFGMFFIVIPMANSMIRDRQLGIFKRLLSFPVRGWQIMAGKTIPYFLINILQFFSMFAVGILVLPRLTGLHLNLDFSWAQMLVITAVCALAATSYGLMVACSVRTAEQASAFGALSVVILAVIGGVMIPRVVMPDFMQSAAMVSPLFWGLESYLDLLVRKLTLVAILPRLSWLFIFAVVCLMVCKLRFRWSEGT